MRMKRQILGHYGKGMKGGAVAAAAMLLAGCSTVEDAPRGEAAYALMPAPAAVGRDYVISPDDVLRIQVYHEPDLSL